MALKMTNRRIQALETKDSIYHAAIDLFMAKGYENVSVEDITKAANTAKGTFYIHFKSKKDLLYYTFNKFDEIYANTYKETRRIPTFEERFLTFIAGSYREIDAMGREIPKAIYYNSILETDPMLLQNSRVLYKIILEMIELGLKTGELSSKRTAEDYLDVIKTQITGMDYRLCIARDVDLADYAKEYMKICLMGLKVYS